MQDLDSHTYQIVREEPPGPLAKVYVATHPDRPGLYLVEVLTGAPRGTAGPALESFEADIAAAALIGHPCVLEALDVGALPDGTPVVVSELTRGISFNQWLEEGRSTSPASALEVVAGVAEALAAAHESGLAHGCVGQDTVFLSDSADDGPGMPRLHGWGRRWFMRGARPPARRPQVMTTSPQEIAADVRGLATLAELMLSPPELRTAAAGRSFGTGPAVATLITRAVAAGQGPGGQGHDTGAVFASTVDFVEALEAAIATDEISSSGMILAAPTSMARIQRVARVHLRKPPPLVMGMLAGSSVSMLILGVLALTGPRPLSPSTADNLISAPEPAVDPPALVDVAATTPRREPVPAPPPVPVRAADPPSAAAVVNSPAPPVPPPAPAPAAAPLPTREAVASLTDQRRPRGPRLRTRVWSDRYQRLISVDEHGEPLDAPTIDEPRPSPVEPGPLAQ